MVSSPGLSLFVCGESNRKRRLCNGGRISNVWGGGNGTGWGVSAVVVVNGAASFTPGVFGAGEDLASGVRTVGDLEAMMIGVTMN